MLRLVGVHLHAKQLVESVVEKGCQLRNVEVQLRVGVHRREQLLQAPHPLVAEVLWQAQARLRHHALRLVLDVLALLDQPACFVKLDGDDAHQHRREHVGAQDGDGEQDEGPQPPPRHAVLFFAHRFWVVQREVVAGRVPFAPIHGNVEDLVPRVERLDSEDGEHGTADGPKVERVVLLESEHAHARQNVVEHHDQNADPPHR
mmetsp:Transcript_83383/g.166934  ORF Transcript_83383/g.166934 Transcript_83383/m.166934 type:complete len:203 (-) Transcript_83383:1076-1684(-)